MPGYLPIYLLLGSYTAACLWSPNRRAPDQDTTSKGAQNAFHGRIKHRARWTFQAINGGCRGDTESLELVDITSSVYGWSNWASPHRMTGRRNHVYPIGRAWAYSTHADSRRPGLFFGLRHAGVRSSCPVGRISPPFGPDGSGWMRDWLAAAATRSCSTYRPTANSAAGSFPGGTAHGQS